MGLRGPGARPLKVAAVPIKRPVRRRQGGATRAERVIRWCEGLTVTAGAHAGRKLVLREWQREIIRAVYATDAAGRRVVRTALLTLPRKNGKTGLVAALTLCHLAGCEAEPRGQTVSAAADKAQAAILFREMKAMVLANPELAERIVIRDFDKTLEDSVTGSTYAALSADAKTKHGFSASLVIYDELAQAPDRQLFDVLTTSTAARAEPLTWVISTQSSDPNHVMSELVDYGRQVLDGTVVDPSFYATIYAAPDDADPWDEAVWHACNPALGDFRSLDEMRAYAAQARRIPARESTFRSLYLNQQCDADVRFIASADWRALGVDPIDIEALRGRPCWAGLDLSSTTDLTSCVLYFPQDGGAVLPFFWIPGDGLDERETRDHVPYRLWRDQGFLETTRGRAIDKTAVAGRLAELASRYDIRGVAYDRWRIADLRRALEDDGIDLPLIDWGQGFQTMGPAVDRLETLALAGEIKHGNHPVLAWNMSSVVVVQDSSGNRKFDKARAVARIDGAVALAAAVGLAARAPAPASYAFTGMLVG